MMYHELLCEIMWGGHIVRKTPAGFVFLAAAVTLLSGCCVYGNAGHSDQKTEKLLSQSELYRLTAEKAEASETCISAYTVPDCSPGSILQELFSTHALCRTGIKSVQWNCCPADGVQSVCIQLDYGLPRYVLNRRKMILRKYAEAFAASVQQMCPPQRALAAYERLTAHCSYSKAGEDVHSAYGALIEGQAVCTGYAEAYLLLCEFSGIPCMLVNGTADGVPHAWDLVCLDGSWYHADPTWDDRGDSWSHSFFLCRDSMMSETHSWNRADYPEAAGERYSYSGIVRSML